MAKKKKPSIVSDEVIMTKIHFLRGERIMLDKDLAELYCVKPIRLREQVKRNAEKFPAHFMFQLTTKETNNMLAQNAVSSTRHLGGFAPFAFTEHGILMLANVVKSSIATAVSIRIIENFVRMKKILSTNKKLLTKLQDLECKVKNNEIDIQKVFLTLKRITTAIAKERSPIGFRRGGEQ